MCVCLYSRTTGNDAAYEQYQQKQNRIHMVSVRASEQTVTRKKQNRVRVRASEQTVTRKKQNRIHMICVRASEQTVTKIEFV